MVIWLDPTFQFILFALAFALFYGIAFSVLLGIRDNYRRYYQKADLQWTGKESRFRSSAGRLRIVWILAAACATSWAVVEYLN